MDLMQWGARVVEAMQATGTVNPEVAVSWSDDGDPSLTIENGGNVWSINPVEDRPGVYAKVRCSLHGFETTQIGSLEDILGTICKVRKD